MRRAACSLAAIGFALGACAGATDSSTDRGADEALGQPGCFYGRQVQDFRVLDRSSLLVFAPTRRHAYRLEISPPSSELRFADVIAFESPSGQICGRAGERLLLGTRDVRRFVVMDVQQLTAAQVDLLLAADDGAAIEPQPGGAAEIEALETDGDQ